MNIEFSVDWLNYTALAFRTRVLTDIAYPMDTPEWINAIPAKGYTSGLQNRNGVRLSWHTKRDDMGAHVQYSGQCLAKYHESGITARTIALRHQIEGDRCSRIDLALDCHNSGLNIGKLASDVKAQIGQFSSKVFSHIQSQDQGETLYLGSRTSELFLRIYNKSAEQAVSGDWVRVELECKGSRAHDIGHRLAYESEQGMVTLTRGLIRNQAAFDDTIWAQIVGDLAVSIAKAHVREPDRKGWLLGLVAPAMGKYLAETGDEAIIEQFLAIVDAFSKVT